MPARHTRRQSSPRNYWTALLLETSGARLERGGGGCGTVKGARGRGALAPRVPESSERISWVLEASGGIRSALGSCASHPGDAGGGGSGGADERSGIMTNTFGPE